MLSVRTLPGLLLVLSLTAPTPCGESRDVWEPVEDGSRAFRLDIQALESSLETAPVEFDDAADAPWVQVAMPMPDGTLVRFEVRESPVMHPELAAKYPGIKTYGGRGLDDPTAVLRFDIGPRGLHGIILSGGRAVLIRPQDGGTYRGLRGSDVFGDEPVSCFSVAQEEHGTASRRSKAENPPTVSRGGQILIYRIAVGATGEYTASQGGTKELALAAITSTINQANAIFQSEAGIFLDLVANEDQVIYTDPATDPYTSGDLSCASPVPACTSPLAPLDCLRTENQCTLDAVIGSANYDIGIVLDGANIGGVAAIGSVCSSIKARAAADGNRFQVVVHEIAHEFGALHTFNDNMNNSCGNAGQWDSNGNVSPGSGSTLMSYAGDCGSANLQRARDSYFHSENFAQMYTFTETGGGAACRDIGFSQNYPPIIRSVTSPATIPSRTPFMLQTDAYDPNGPVTIAWEQADTSGASSPPEGDDGTRPLFRVYPPTASGTRSFPSEKYVLENGNVPPTTYFGGPLCESAVCSVGESLPTTDRTMTFRVIVRDGDDGIATATTTVTTRADAGPFRVSAPNGNVAGMCWSPASLRTVTWDVAGTDLPPIGTTAVNILLSTDDGETYPYTLATNTPNDGSEEVRVPDVVTGSARVKIEASGNIFYDVSDAPFAIGFPIVSNTNDSGCGSLRQAITDYNELGALSGGVWDVPLALPNAVNTIVLQSPLPSIQASMILYAWSIGGDGYTGPPLLELDGQNALPSLPGTPVDGLVISGQYTSVTGVAVHGFDGDGVRISGASDVEIDGCHIGTDATGTIPKPNGGSGIVITEGSSNRIHRSVISGNNGSGVVIEGSSASGNRVYGNKIGTDVTGSQRLPNGLDGVRIAGSPSNTIGGLAPGDRNIISGNGRLLGLSVATQADGIEISGASATGNSIQQNYIGLNGTGDAALDNSHSGIRIVGAPNTRIGGTEPLAGNVIADRGVINLVSGHGIDVSGAAPGIAIQGNSIGTDATGNIDLGPRGNGIKIDGTPGVLVGGLDPSAKNLISGANSSAGIYVLNGGSATIQGNFIGTNAAGTAAIGNNAYGIWLNSAGNTIGGTDQGARNLISGNVTGIFLEDQIASGNSIQGNFIGTDVTGTIDLGNAAYGVSLSRAPNNLIGGAAAAMRNVISGNNNAGVYISGSVGATAPGNVIRGNYIGTDVTGASAVPNGTGIYMSEVTDTTIGGAEVGEGNVISGQNLAHGIDIFTNAVTTSGISIQGNSIGTNAAGTAKLGNAVHGISAAIRGTITIGGLGAAGNVISGNGQNGINLCCGVGNAIVRGNKIGTDASGLLNLGNGYSGAVISSGDGHLVGGTAPGEGNVIAFNSIPGSGFNFAGVKVTAGVGTSIRGNTVTSNVGLGIDIGGLGLTANDACDADTGANDRQNFPVVSAASQSGANTFVEGSLDSLANSSFSLDFYANAACDESGYGEGATYLGSTILTTDGDCAGSFALTLPLPASGFVTAIATATNGSTSEFSACRAIAESSIGEAGPLAWTSKTELTWNPASGATVYRLVRGVLSDLPQVLTTLDDSCERYQGPATTTGPTLTEDPSGVAGRLYWYLVYGEDGMLDGPAGNATSGPRIVNTPVTCPNP